MLAASLHGASLTVNIGMLPSTDVIKDVKISYGSQLNSYTNSLTFSSEYVNASWITNSPRTGGNFRTCEMETIPCYWQLTITNLTGGQTFAIKIENVFRGGGPAKVYESGCLHTIPQVVETKPDAPLNLKFIQ